MEEYDLDSIVHFLMNRLKQQEESILKWSTEKRQKYFKLEKKLYDEETPE
jgi:hypothetical protein